MSLYIPTVADVHQAKEIVHQYVTPAPLVRSYALEKELGLPKDRRVWLKDYGWTPVGSYKLLGALNWMYQHLTEIGDRPVVAHSSGNFASGIAYAGWTFGKDVFVIMPDTAPRIKFERTKSFGAQVITFEAATDFQTGNRLRFAEQLVQERGGILASPYDDPWIIAGQGVGGLEIVEELRRQGRDLSLFVAPVSGGGLMAGHALAIADGFPQSKIIGVEPEEASDFHQSMQSGERTRIPHPKSICDGLLSYEVGKHNWPILKQYVREAVAIADANTKDAMKWLYVHHGLRVEPSGAIATAALLTRKVEYSGTGDIVLTVSGRNIDEERFRQMLIEAN